MIDYGRHLEGDYETKLKNYKFEKDADDRGMVEMM